MASDNFDQGHGLSDSELRCIHGMRTAILTLDIPETSSQGSGALSQFDAVMTHVHVRPEMATKRFGFLLELRPDHD